MSQPTQGPIPAPVFSMFAQEFAADTAMMGGQPMAKTLWMCGNTMAVIHFPLSVATQIGESLGALEAPGDAPPPAPSKLILPSTAQAVAAQRSRRT